MAKNLTTQTLSAADLDEIQHLIDTAELQPHTDWRGHREDTPATRKWSALRARVIEARNAQIDAENGIEWDESIETD